MLTAIFRLKLYHPGGLKGGNMTCVSCSLEVWSVCICAASLTSPYPCQYTFFTVGWIKPSNKFCLNPCMMTLILLGAEGGRIVALAWNWRDHAVPHPPLAKSVKLHVVTLVRARSRPGVLVWNRKSYSLVWSHSCRACLHEHTGQFGTHDPWYLICRACSRPQSSKPKGISLHDSSDCAPATECAKRKGVSYAPF